MKRNRPCEQPGCGCDARYDVVLSDYCLIEWMGLRRSAGNPVYGEDGMVVQRECLRTINSGKIGLCHDHFKDFLAWREEEGCLPSVPRREGVGAGDRVAEHRIHPARLGV